MTPKPDAPAAKLACKECGYENEPQRVYCHNCGAKLDREVIAKKEKKPAASERKQKETLRRVRKAQGKGFDAWRELFGPLTKVTIYGLLMASMIEMVRKPDLLPEPPEISGQMPLILYELDAMLNSPTPLQKTYSEAEVNEYLRSTLKAKGTTLGGALAFSRAFVNFYSDNVCRLGIEQKLFDYPLYATVNYTPVEKSAGLGVRTVSGAVGRLPIHPLAMESARFLFGAVWSKLDKEIERLSKMQSVIISERAATVRTAGSVEARAR